MITEQKFRQKSKNRKLLTTLQALIKSLTVTFFVDSLKKIGPDCF
jgi:hypothetical protein